MSIYNDKFKGYESQPSENDILELSYAIINNVMRNLHVASIGIVTKINEEKINVKLIPTNEGENEKEVIAYNYVGLTLEENDKVLLIYTDNDFRENIEALKNNKTKLNKNTNMEKHIEKFGIIINKLIL